jgi:class 3 adenylate cyclase/tetratricopeptide (TPR) repeat protein
MGREVAVVLFTDLVGSTELRSRLGEEAADELRRRHDQLLAQAVEANNGSVVKGLGDGIMAAFAGASDAVAAAVAIQQAVDRLNRSSKAAEPIAVRIGLSAGDVTFENDDVHGTPVIEASRLCGAAAGGEILAADLVRALAGSATEAGFAGVGPLELRGLAQPLLVVRVGWEPATTSAIPLPALLTDVGRVFVGRDADVEHLNQLWKEGAAGDRRVALLAGEPGVGKTRLAAELAGQVHETGAIVLAGRCDEDLGVPFQPFVEALHHYAVHASEPRLGRYGGELVRLLPELANKMPGLPDPLRSDPETERYRLFDAVASWLGEVSADDPVLVVLDDVHWAAKPTLLLLRHILRSPEPLRLLVVATYRDSEVGRGHPLAELLADLRRVKGVERFPLTGLDQAGVVAFIEAAAGRGLGEDDEDLARAVWTETEGNPFFVVEVLRHLAETGGVEQRDGRWVMTAPVDKLGIPEGVRDVVGRRLSRLSEAANRVLWVASVAGLEFDPAVVRMAGDLSDEALFSSLEEAVVARLVSESGSRYRFGHALVRATLYDEMTTARRVAIHKKVAEAIEAIHAGDLDDQLPALAHHWARASAPAADTARAVDYATKAGDRALAQLAHDEAVAYYRQARELLEASPGAGGPQHTHILISLGEAERRAGDPAHRETLLRACALAAEQDNPDALARAALANTRGTFSSVVGDVDAERVAAFETALDLARDDDSPTRARLLAALGRELVFTGDRRRRVRLADEALAIARRCGDVATLAHVLLDRFYTIAFPDTLEERLANSEELLPLAEHLGDPVITVRALLLCCRNLGESGDMEEADRHLEAAERLTEELGQPTLRWLVGLITTTRTILAGHLDEAERRIHACFELGQATGQPDAGNFAAVHLFLVRLEQDRLGELEERYVEVLAALPGVPGIRAYMARLLCELDRPDEATVHYETLAAQNFTALPEDTVWLLALPHCAVVCAALGDRPRAQVLFDLLLPYAHQLILTAGGALGAVSHHLAVLATTFGDFDEAERRFVSAGATHERIGAPIWLARTRLEWARMLITRAQPGDAERAREFLGQALETARQLGLANVERRAVELLT